MSARYSLKSEIFVMLSSGAGMSPGSSFLYSSRYFDTIYPIVSAVCSRISLSGCARLSYRYLRARAFWLSVM